MYLPILLGLFFSSKLILFYDSVVYYCTRIFLMSKKGGRLLASIEDYIHATIHGPEEYRKKTKIWQYWYWTQSNIQRRKKNTKWYLRRTKKLLETKRHCKNLIKGINTWPVLLVRYSGSFLKWTREELGKNSWDRSEYLEESWRFETCDHSDSRERHQLTRL